MHTGALQTELVTGEDGLVRLVIGGELDVATADQLERAIQHALSRSANIELDLTGLTFIDSSGLRVFLGVHKAAATTPFEYHIVAGPRAVHRTFALSGLDQVLTFASAASSSSG